MRLPKIIVLIMPSPQGAWYMTSTALPSNDAAALVKARNEIQRGFVEGTRLGIPVSFVIETLHSGGLDARPAPQPRPSGWLLHSFKTPLVNPGSRYRCGKGTQEQPVRRGRRKGLKCRPTDFRRPPYSPCR